MQDIFFYIFAFLTLLCGFMVVANPFSRNPVTSAMFLVLTIASMAGLFVLLHAFFLAAVQVLVYAGAVMVLFLFVIMLLDLGEEERRRLNKVALGVGGLAVLALFGILANASFVGAKTVKGPVPESVSTSPAALMAVTSRPIRPKTSGAPGVGGEPPPPV